mgnify:CR=1 FL=1
MGLTKKTTTAIEIAVDTANPTVTYACQVIGVTPLSANTYQVELQSPAGTVLDYQAGQYLQLDLDINRDGRLDSLFYSITNGFDPKQPCRLQLFIQNSSGLTEAIIKHLFQLSKNNTTAKVTLPMGQAYLQTDLVLTHLLVASGSGISKIKCLTEEILRQHADADVNIYWSNRNIDEFYLLDKFKAWVVQNDNLNFTPVLESAGLNWQGRSGYIYEVIKNDFEDLAGAQAYLCGSPKMVYGTIDKLKATGLKEENCYSDVFEYAPRN